MFHVIRRLQFCAGHRVMGHEGKCQYPHGHNYVIYVHARNREGENTLDGVGRVIDFGVLKDEIGGWLDRNWDHGFIVYREDKVLCDALKGSGAKVFMLPANPTAEEIGRYLLHVVCPLLIGDPIEVFQIDVDETENCCAVVKLPE